MDSRNVVPLVPRMSGLLRFSPPGVGAVAALAGALLTAVSCIPADVSRSRMNGGTSDPTYVPPLPQPPGSPGAPGGAPTVDPSAPPPAPPAEPPTSDEVSLVVGNEDLLTQGDEELSDLLEDLGFRVNEVDDEDDSEDAEDSGLVVIAGSAVSVIVEDEYRNLRVPVMVLDSGILADMRMTSDDNDEAGQSNEEEVEIARPEHPIAAGVTGRIEVVGDNTQLQWGVPPAAAQVIAVLADDPERAAIFAYNPGDQMDGQQAPHRRVAFFAGDAAAEDLTDEGEQLFENAVLWAWSGGALRPD
jgi:hypothetical protein